MRERVCTELLLPLGEVGALDGRNSILLLPFSEIVGVSRRVKTKHLGLKGPDGLGDEWSLEVHLRDDVLLVEKFSLVHISASELGADQELLTLTEWRDPVGVLGLLGWVHGKVKAGLRGRESRGVEGNHKRDITSFS